MQNHRTSSGTVGWGGGGGSSLRSTPSWSRIGNVVVSDEAEITDLFC